ncbi:hypothetical protein CASFOL_001046 [Castilleja foliolosa]|uniref:Uncharacterized protein n=1 Tax=Castilleja foliolosa TaxID=1961234 RepID=A0ABD3ELG1_9LAMI
MMELTTWLLQFLAYKRLRRYSPDKDYGLDSFAADLGYAAGDSLEKPTKPGLLLFLWLGFGYLMLLIICCRPCRALLADLSNGHARRMSSSNSLYSFFMAVGNEAVDNVVNEIFSFYNKSGESAGDKLMVLSGELKEVSGNTGLVALKVICNQQDEDDHGIVTKTHLQNIRGTLDLTETTPMIKEPMSSFRIGKQAGENTLKKELWTKFEAATAFDEPILEDDDPTKKGFLDRLDEALDS